LPVVGIAVTAAPARDEKQPPEAPVLPVSQPVRRQVVDSEDFTGRLDARETVDIRARVQGYLVAVRFTEGAMVRKGDLLFAIDPRPYEARPGYQLAQVKIQEAAVELADATLRSDEEANRLGKGNITELQVAQDKAVLAEARARVEAAKKNLYVY